MAESVRFETHLEPINGEPPRQVSTLLIHVPIVGFSHAGRPLATPRMTVESPIQGGRNNSPPSLFLPLPEVGHGKPLVCL